MGFEISDNAKEINERLEVFMEEHIYPRERDYDEFTSNQDNLWQYPGWYEDLKKEAKKQELWNLFLPKEYAPWSPGLSNLEIAGLFETMSKSAWAQQIFNCNAPDRGNMEVLAKYGTPEQQKEWLEPLLAGEIRSAYAMTEPDVASSDATNMELEIRRDGDEYVLNGKNGGQPVSFHPSVSLCWLWENQILKTLAIHNTQQLSCLLMLKAFQSQEP